ncbi:hypothetical protein [Dactylosporangium salmoneum]|uniref:Uncharacterized protein n=1 Tax=Dactylosporangium salmoneum TaxID=53361 RepID=A0ABP5UUR5_9ACTN
MSSLSLDSAERRGMVVADWALYSKVPGQKMDYEVRAASMDAALAERCIRSVLAGTAAGPAPGRPEALPWYGFTGRLGDRPAAAIMELSWSEERDFTGQPITPARLLVAEPAGAARESLTYTRLAAALFDLDWHGIHAGPPGAAGGHPMRLTPPPADADALAADIERLGVDFIGSLAALVLDGGQIVFTAAEDRYPAVVERIRLLDAVCALLPYAYRHYLSAATWASHRARHRITLTFAERAAAGQVEVSLDTRIVPPLQTEEAQAYVRVLVALLKKGKTVTQVVQHLAVQTQLELCRGPADAVDLLHRMDMPGLVLRAIKAGQADLGEVAAVLDRFGFEGLDDEDMRQRYCAYLLDKVVRDGPDAAAAWRILTGAWSPTVVAALAGRVYAALTAGDQPILDRLTALLGGLPVEWATAVVRRLTTAVATHPRREDIAAYIGLLARVGPAGNDEEVHRTFLAHPAAGIQLVTHLFGAGGALEPVLERWASLVTDETRWALPVIVAANGDMARVGTDDFAALNKEWPDGDLTAMKVAARNGQLVPMFQRHSGAIAHVGARLRLAGDEESRADFRNHLVAVRKELYRDIPAWQPSDFKHHGRLDVVLMLAGIEPRGVLNLSNIPRAFLSAMGQLWRSRGLDQVRPYLVERLAAALDVRSGRLGQNADVYDVMSVVDAVEPSLRAQAAGRISAYLGANVEQRKTLELGPDWAALIEPWLRRITHLAQVCADTGSTLPQVTGAMAALMDEPIADYGQVFEALRPWLQPDRGVDTMMLIWGFRTSPNGRHVQFGDALLDTVTNPGGPLRDFRPNFIMALRVMAAQVQYMQPWVDRYQPQLPAAPPRPSPSPRPPHQAPPPPQFPQEVPPKRAKGRFRLKRNRDDGKQQ